MGVRAPKKIKSKLENVIKHDVYACLVEKVFEYECVIEIHLLGLFPGSRFTKLNLKTY